MAPRLLSGNQVVYIMMEFGSMLLWDEASKKRFIDSVLEEKCRLGIEVYAFSIFSDRAFLLTGKFGAYTEEEACRDVLIILQHYLETGWLTQDDRRLFQNGSNLKLSLCLLNGRDEIVNALIYVHLVARDLGYVRAAFDYWWSSIQIYRNRPSWNGLNAETVYENLSPDSGRSRRNLVRRHREIERSGRFFPNCLSAPVIFTTLAGLPSGPASPASGCPERPAHAAADAEASVSSLITRAG